MNISQDQLIEKLVFKGVLHTPAIIDAFKSVDRKDFVLPEYESEAYADHSLTIGYSQTISQPYTVAFMLELLAPQEGENILDVGSGSGWATALLANIVGPKGHVWGLEIIPELVQFGRENIAKYPYKNMDIVQAEKQIGLRKHALYDKILVSAESTTVPEELEKQLKVDGTMVIPVQKAIWKVTRTGETKTEIEKFEGFVFVPLIH